MRPCRSPRRAMGRMSIQRVRKPMVGNNTSFFEKTSRCGILVLSMPLRQLSVLQMWRDDSYGHSAMGRMLSRTGASRLLQLLLAVVRLLLLQLLLAVVVVASVVAGRCAIVYRCWICCWRLVQLWCRQLVRLCNGQLTANAICIWPLVPLTANAIWPLVTIVL